MAHRTSTTNPDDPNRMIGLPAAADLLDVSDRTVRRYIADGKLPAYRLAGGTNFRVRRGDVDALLAPLPTTGTVDADAS